MKAIIRAISRLLVVCAVAGCARIPPATQSHFVPGLTVICAPQPFVQASHPEYAHSQSSVLKGFAILESRIIIVEWSDEVDTRGEPLPNFETLGHELWHLIKGKFHN